MEEILDYSKQQLDGVFLLHLTSASCRCPCAGPNLGAAPGQRGRTALTGKGNKGGAGRAKVECSDLATRAECVASSGGSRCRWCQSEVLDDMCFGATEA
ncbi:hypothetical protein E2562_006268 [Oryza meyeriana var. granulata]|uniref:Uncharacterized protein n=1 Tax=Oryza meyeriana var. granulata TaxID=110450 RepID=A0A6G1EEZ4_9ORYZ|nr:hypothetical protein E2562_006268 [Oryza meyeriana var. granulata]